MFQSRSEYDRGVNTFSPEGRLFQVEYAIEAIKIGTTAIGISTSEGIVLAVEKRLLSPLQEASSVEKLAEIDSHIGCAMSGLSADARTLIDHARSESQYHRFTFNEPMKVDSLTQAVCDLALRFGESGEENTMSRPFGVALLVEGWDKHGPALYHTDPSGTFTRFDAKAKRDITKPGANGDTWNWEPMVYGTDGKRFDFPVRWSLGDFIGVLTVQTGSFTEMNEGLLLMLKVLADVLDRAVALSLSEGTPERRASAAACASSSARPSATTTARLRL